MIESRGVLMSGRQVSKFVVACSYVSLYKILRTVVILSSVFSGSVGRVGYLLNYGFS